MCLKFPKHLYRLTRRYVDFVCHDAMYPKGPNVFKEKIADILFQTKAKFHSPERKYMTIHASTSLLQRRLSYGSKRNTQQEVMCLSYQRAWSTLIPRFLSVITKDLRYPRSSKILDKEVGKILLDNALKSLIFSYTVDRPAVYGHPFSISIDRALVFHLICCGWTPVVLFMLKANDFAKSRNVLCWKFLLLTVNHYKMCTQLQFYPNFYLEYFKMKLDIQQTGGFLLQQFSR